MHKELLLNRDDNRTFFDLRVHMIVEQCKRWVEDFVIGHNLCPFAQSFAKRGEISYRLSRCSETEARLHEFLEELDALESSDDYRTTLLIYDDPRLDFTAYLDLYELCESLIEHEERVFQLASFHPRYRFEGLDDEDPANLSNRSPFPIIHILRIDDVSRAIDEHPDTARIPARNIRYLRETYGDG